MSSLSIAALAAAVISVLCATWCGRRASRKGGSVWRWAVAGLLLGPLAVIFAVVTADRSLWQTCGKCGKTYLLEDVRCSCGEPSAAREWMTGSSEQIDPCQKQIPDREPMMVQQHRVRPDHG